MSPGVVGLFVGGSARRMGGFPKGLLRGEHGLQIVEYHWQMAKKLSWEPVLVGKHPAYADFARERQLVCLEDSPLGIGPLGGFGALLRFAGCRFCIALACDMPHVVFEDLEALALWPSQAAALVPRRKHWEPLFGRYEAWVVRPALEAYVEAGGRSFQRFLEALQPEVFFPKAPKTLEDWDFFEDIHSAKSR